MSGNGNGFYGRIVLLFAKDGEIPEHIQKTFGLIKNGFDEGYHSRPGVDYRVVMLGENIPSDVDNFIIFYYTDTVSIDTAFDLVAQVEQLNPKCKWIAFPIID